MSQLASIDSENLANLHEQLQDMLAGYADNELNEKQILQVEAHLAGCKDCRNDLARQMVVSDRLSTLSQAKVSVSLHQKLDQVTERTTGKAHTALLDLPRQLSIDLVKYLRRFFSSNYVGTGGWLVATALLITLFFPIQPTDMGAANIPMVDDALVQYDEMKGKILPVSSQSDSIKLPLKWPNAHLLASWKTQIAGSPAQAFAVRTGDNIVFQYQIDEAVFFRSPEVRKAVAQAGNYQDSTGNIDILALPLKKSGLLVVGPTGSFPKSI